MKNRHPAVLLAPFDSDDQLPRGVSRLRWRRRMFLFGPLFGFLIIVTMIRTQAWVRVGAWLVGAAIAATAVWSALCLWWAPRVRCPRCGDLLGGDWFSARNAVWMWHSRPTCPACKFDPFGPTER